MFDILLLNSQSYLETPLEDRLKILQSKLLKSNADGTIMVSMPTEISKIQDFYNFYTDHMKRGEEGVVIKVSNSFLAGNLMIRGILFRRRSNSKRNRR